MIETSLTARAPGLYIHVPFCARVCPYCDFAVLVGGEARRERFVENLIGEIRLWGGAEVKGLSGFDTVYFGGGTPSTLTRSQLERILESLAREMGLDEPWIFLEANPEDVSEESLDDWRALGVRTLSLGVQSFHDDELDFLGRLHRGKEARESAELAVEAGFEAVSLDLIFGLPGQEESAWRSNLETAVSLRPDHVSCYQLTVHEGTAFGARRQRGDLVELAEDGQADLFLLAHRFLHAAGYPAYEVSNFARAPEYQSRHNSKYWDHTAYLGLGPSAHSFVGNRRWWNEKRLGAWQRRLQQGERPIEGSENLSLEDLAAERLMFGMRTAAGIDLGEFAERYGQEIAVEGSAAMERLVEEQLVEIEGRALRPTSRGLAVADSLVRSLLQVARL